MRKTLFLLAWPLVAAFLPLLSHGACPRDALRLSELCFWPQAGQPQWVEIANTSTEETFNCAGVEIVSNGASYSLPNELADVPPGAKIVIYFDGETAQNDYAFDGDNKAELHPPAPGRATALGNPVGYCSLFRVTSAHGVDTLLDFVAWGGEPGDAAKDAVEKRLWSTTGVYLAPPASEMRDGPGAKMIVQGGTLGRVNEAWKILSPAQATPGMAFVTVLTAPILEFPSDGLQGDAPTRLWFKGVEGAAGYQVQVSDIVVFSNLLVDGETAQAAFFLTGVTLAGDTTYYWRVRSLNGTGDSSPWSIVYSFTVGTNDVRREQGSAKTSVPATRDGKTVTGKVVDKATNNGLPGVEVQLGTEKKNSDASGNFSFPGVAPGTYPITMTLKGYTFPAGLTVVVAAADVVVPNTQGEGKTKNLGIDPKGGARKDTKMLAIKPGASSKIMCDKTSVSKQNWCTANPRPTHHPKDLESWWCWAVGIGMVNWHYGGTLTRDEIVYKVRAEILHDEDAGSHWGNYITGLYWAFGQAGAAKFDIRNRGGANVTEDEMVTWLDANRPIYFRRPGHIMVIDGYRYRDGKFECKFLNTDNNGAQKWWVFSTVANGGVACPKTELAASARKTDVKIAADGDGDGVCDFDEDHRFASSKTSADSDGDGLNDKIEITSWVFPRESTGRLNTTGKKFNVPDVDGDGLYPEVDPDTDNGGLKDGEEDKDKDAIWDKGGTVDQKETDVYDTKDDGLLDLVFCIDTTGSMGGDIGQVKVNAIQIVNDIETKFPSFQVGVVDYRDFASRTHNPNDYPARTQIGFSNDKTAIVSAINGLSLGYGGDGPETVFSGIIHAIDALSGWRESATRIIIVMGDAPPLNPEPFTGYTVPYVAAKAFLGGFLVGGRDGGFSGSIPVYTIPTSGGARVSFADIASQTGGLMIEAPSPSQVPAAMMEAVDDARTRPIAKLEVTGDTGDPSITADASGSRDLERCGIVTYEWDWDSDGAFDETSFAPILVHHFARDGFGGTMRVRVTTVSGASSIAVFVRDAEAIIGDVLDVTDDVTTDWPADGWTMDPRTGTMFGTFSLTNNTDSSKTLKEVFRYAVPDTDQIRLMHPDGTLDDGTPYVDITALVEAALPTVGNGDLNLDPGETVTITGIEFYSFDRTAPAGYVFAVWADPPMEEPTVATRADLNWHATFSSGTQRGALELVIGAATGATEGLDAFFDVPTDEFAELWSVPADLDTPAMQQDIRPLAGTGSWMIGALGDAGPLDLSWTRSDLPMGLMLTLTRLDEDGQPLQATRVEVTSDGVIEVDGDAGLGIDLGTEASVELHLALGWNMVSFPMIPVPGTVETLLAALPEQAEVQQYENGVYADADAATALNGLWIYSPEEMVIPMRGLVVAAPALTLEEGWNLIGVPFECPIPDCAVDSVWEWIDRRYAAAAVLEPGKAYWLYSSEDRTIRLAAPQE